MSRFRRSAVVLALGLGAMSLAACGRSPWGAVRLSGPVPEPAQPEAQGPPAGSRLVTATTRPDASMAVPPGVVLCSGYIADEKTPDVVGTDWAAPIRRWITSMKREITPKPVGVVSRGLGRGAAFGLEDVVFLDVDRPEAVARGDQFSVIRAGDPVVHPTTGERLGLLVETVATLEVIAVEARLVRARIIQACGDVLLNDGLIPAQPVPVPVRSEGVPAAPLEGTIVAAKGWRTSVGLSYIAYIDAGAEKGIVLGDVFTAYQPSETLKLRGHTSLHPQRETIPPHPIGELMVIRTSARTSTVLVTQSAEDMFVGLRVSLKSKAGPGGPK